MFKVTLDGSQRYAVQFRNHVIQYASDGSAPNPLAATFAALAGCAGVYASKACHKLGIDSTGIAIECKPVMKAGDMVIPARFVTDVRFPDGFPAEHKAAVIEEIGHCAVKELLHAGPNVEFETRERA